MNNFVVSNPADDLRDRRLVFITSPEGRTTVYRKITYQRTHRKGIRGKNERIKGMLTAFKNHSPFAVP
jgi:hypothetical protein